MEISVRQTFEMSHRVLQSCIDAMEAFGGFYHRIRYADDYNFGQLPAVPGTCRSPRDLWNHWQRLTRDWESLDVHYSMATLADMDIKRALAGHHISVPAMLNVDADTHVEALCQIADRIRGALRTVCSGSLLPESYEDIDRSPDLVLETCAFAADRLRDYAHNETIASDKLSYLRRSIFKEEEACRQYFNPDGPIAAPKGAPGRRQDEAKTLHAIRANELRSATPQAEWKDVAKTINVEFQLTGTGRYDHEQIRLLHRDKIKAGVIRGN